MSSRVDTLSTDLGILTKDDPFMFDTLKEIVDYYNNLDSNQGSQINNLVNQVNILQSQIDYLLAPPVVTVPNIPLNVVASDINYDNVTSFTAGDYAFLLSYARKLNVPLMTPHEFTIKYL